MALTKSLHTVTATVNVARVLMTQYPGSFDGSASDLADRALSVLGYDMEAFSADDPTIAAIVKQISKLVQA